MKLPFTPRRRTFMAVAGILAAAALSARAADPLVDSAVTALAQLTDPQRLARLPEPAFRAQLGPALGWLHVARRRDVAPEAVIGRALALNGLSGEQARLTREALLRNLARADAWELFTSDASARALADGRPAPIQTGLHRGHLAAAEIVAPPSASADPRHDFACLVLRADDDPVARIPSAPATRHRHVRQPGDLLAQHVPVKTSRPASRSVAPSPAAAPLVGGLNAAMAVTYDDALPISYATLASDNGMINIRISVQTEQPVDLAAYGGPPVRFVWRGQEAHALQFSLSDAGSAGAGSGQTRSVDVAASTGDTLVYQDADRLRINLLPAAVGQEPGTRTFLFQFQAAQASPSP